MPTTTPVLTVTAQQARELLAPSDLSLAFSHIQQAILTRAAENNYIETSIKLTDAEADQLVEMLEDAGFHVVVDGFNGREEALRKSFCFCVSWAAESPWPKPETPSEKVADQILNSGWAKFFIGVMAGVAVVMLGVQLGKLL